MEQINSLNNRIIKLENSIGNVNILNELRSINQQISEAFHKLPNLEKLASMSISKYETDEININIILMNYQRYKNLGQKLIALNDYDLNMMNLKPVDIANVIDRKLQILKLVNSFLYNLITSMILVETFVCFVNDQNEFLVDTKGRISKLTAQVKVLECKY